jgi:hypothetical protein
MEGTCEGEARLHLPLRVEEIEKLTGGGGRGFRVKHVLQRAVRSHALALVLHPAKSR